VGLRLRLLASANTETLMLNNACHLVVNRNVVWRFCELVYVCVSTTKHTQLWTNYCRHNTTHNRMWPPCDPDSIYVFSWNQTFVLNKTNKYMCSHNHQHGKTPNQPTARMHFQNQIDHICFRVSQLQNCWFMCCISWVFCHAASKYPIGYACHMFPAHILRNPGFHLPFPCRNMLYAKAPLHD